MRKIHANHGRDHLPTGADPIPGLTIGGSSGTGVTFATLYYDLLGSRDMSVTLAAGASGYASHGSGSTKFHTNDSSTFTWSSSGSPTSSGGLQISQAGCYRASLVGWIGTASLTNSFVQVEFTAYSGASTLLGGYTPAWSDTHQTYTDGSSYTEYRSTAIITMGDWAADGINHFRVNSYFSNQAGATRTFYVSSMIVERLCDSTTWPWA